MKKNKIRNRSILLILAMLGMTFIGIYSYSVPLIRAEVYKIERNSARLALDNVYQLADKMFSSVDTYRLQALESRKASLRTIVDLVGAQLSRSVVAGGDPRAIIKLFEQLRYDEEGYIWIADRNGVLLSHPNPELIGKPISDSSDGQLAILAKIHREVTEKGEAFISYPWQSVGSDTSSEKLSFIRFFPDLGVSIGTGVFMVDIERQVVERREQLVNELRAALMEIKIARTGYMFIFDSSGYLVAHPNSNIDKTNATNLKNPTTGRSIIFDLKSVADTGEELLYAWDSPADPGNYVHEKISLVRKLEGLDWYICSSVYVDELQSSAFTLSQRILMIALISILIAVIVGSFAIDRILSPLRRLASAAQRVKDGDFRVRSGIQSDDELGILASTFDSMVARIGHSVDALGQEVVRKSNMVEQLEERQTLILDALPAQVAYLTSDLRFLFVNREYAAFYGLNKEGIIGRKLSDVIPGSMQVEIASHINRCLSGEDVVFEYVSEGPKGQLITRRRFIPEFDTAGNVVGIFNLSLDITDEKNSERRMLEASRMTAAGQLAGGLTHDFNNLLTVIIGNLLAAKDHNESQSIEGNLSPALRAAYRGADIIRRLMTFARAQSQELVLVGAASAINGVSELIKSSLPASINFNVTGKSDALIEVDLAQFENALINLALNARDSMPDGGQIEICVVNSASASPRGFDEAVVPGEYVLIEVKDSGTGFSRDAIQRAFEPFFTTKKGRGSGLGLSMVYGFAKQSNGYIRILNNSDIGSTISILLPKAKQKDSAVHQLSADAEKLAPTLMDGLLLLVEDDLDVRQVVRDQLTSIGLSVVEASDTDEALLLIDAIPDIRTLISDIDLPGRFNGIELANHLCGNRGVERILLMTGNAEYAVEHSTAACYEILLKPFTREQIVTALNRTVARG
ncbi:MULTISPECIES: cache domain-containing protein [unclassified Marinobacterium]|uniref:cache domain-containing protein n=2 Tax=unclassified Marinobacterium TaxID=2644139 RepID=UPI00156812E9|nr:MULTISPECIES: cache domain-containing protein [unclassified Marinobacterium]NRP14782.1 Blue-light-activated protein [Marinobacterium sp. xm-a-152]NRP38527.1 Blue-light-activated protein [Marinobacterium sp. xm-a-121]NRP58037.1 Blue-light-activated protein [Marinobacterium sp. xm-d-510]NRP98268.1 Blue-light-activated protein [Marinobacterium sp. xm-a-127]